MEYHEVANIFPMMSDEEYRALVSDIQANGLHEPIWTHEGKIIDGRNRYKACLELGIQPTLRAWNGQGSLVAFVVSLNLHRRHLSQSQKSVVALDIEPLLAKEARDRQGRRTDLLDFPQLIAESGEAREQAAKIVGTNRQYVSDAKKLKNESPDLFEQVRSGELSIPEAKREHKKQQRSQARANRPVITLPQACVIECTGTTDHIASNSIDLILTDPPYGISANKGVTKVGGQIVTVDFDGEDEWDSADPAEFLATLATWVAEWARVTRPGGAIIAFTDRALISHLWDLFKFHDLQPKNIITWAKTNPSPAGLARRNLISATEYLIWAVKPGAAYTFNEVDGWDRRNVLLKPICGGYERHDHPTQKPQAILRPLIELVSNPGELILDPFAGVGSTGVAALHLKRRVHLIEKNSDYVTTARHWIAEESEKLHAA